MNKMQKELYKILILKEKGIINKHIEFMYKSQPQKGLKTGIVYNVHVYDFEKKKNEMTYFFEKVTTF